MGYASTCNSVGQTAGYFLGYVVFLALESADFCNNYLRSANDAQPIGMVTLSGIYIIFYILLVLSALVIQYLFYLFILKNFCTFGVGFS